MGKNIQVNAGDKFGRWTVIEEVEPRIVFRKDLNTNERKRMIRCQCDCGVIKVVPLSALSRGATLSCGCLRSDSVSKSRRIICGIGINDYNGLVRPNGIFLPSYLIWKDIIRRCYNSKSQLRRPTYKDCSVCDEWIYFSNFKQWFDEKHIEGYDLDKDILIKGNKLYSPTTCCFVPPDINKLILRSANRRGVYPIGVILHKGRYIARFSANNNLTNIGSFDSPVDAFNAYKIAKESHIKETATKYYKDNKIVKELYDALMSYQIEIDD